jgi:hypothetical protein
MNPDAPFSLERFERFAYHRDHEQAAREMLRLLHRVDQQYGQLDGVVSTRRAVNVEGPDAHVSTRLASALSCLLSDPGFHLSDTGFVQLVGLQRWIGTLFAATPFGNADHVLAALDLAGADGAARVSPAHLAKFCLLYGPDSELHLDVDALWTHHRHAAAALALALLSPRFLGTRAAHGKRETLLGWLPGKLAEFESLDALPRGILHDVYMHCSYADRPDKHEIKRQINRLVRTEVLAHGWTDADLSAAGTRTVRGKPVLVVVLEWFGAQHSVFRTHSASMSGLRRHFHVVGLGGEPHVDAAGREVFDEFVPLRDGFADMVETVRTTVARHAPSVVYYPAIGMFPLTIFLSNMRLAPVQVTALGHGASTMSPFIDHFVVDEDFVGDPATFSERLLPMPPHGMPHVPSAAFRPMRPRLGPIAPAVVRIAVAATTMKLNPRLMDACGEISRRARTPVHFEFLSGLSHGLGESQVRRFVTGWLGNATFHGTKAYADYMALLDTCDLFIDPFPYGNMNGIVDMAHLGMAGICRVGAQVHEHIDAGMFRRLGLPEWLIAGSDEGYVAAAVRLVDGHEERRALRLDLLARDAVQAVFRGDPTLLGERLLALARDASTTTPMAPTVATAAA